MDGSNCELSSRYPTQDKIRVCKGDFVSDETDWDPFTVHFNLSSVYKDNRCEIYAGSPFITFSKYPYDIAL